MSFFRAFSSVMSSFNSLWMNLLHGLFLRCAESFHQPSELLGAHLFHIGSVPRPPELSIFQTFVQQKKSISFPEQSFYSVCSSSAKEKQCPFREWIQIRFRLYDPGETVDTISQVCVSAGDIYRYLICLKIIQHCSAPPESF